MRTMHILFTMTERMYPEHTTMHASVHLNSGACPRPFLRCELSTTSQNHLVQSAAHYLSTGILAGAFYFCMSACQLLYTISFKQQAINERATSHDSEMEAEAAMEGALWKRRCMEAEAALSIVFEATSSGPSAVDSSSGMISIQPICC